MFLQTMTFNYAMRCHEFTVVALSSMLKRLWKEGKMRVEKIILKTGRRL